MRSDLAPMTAMLDALAGAHPEKDDPRPSRSPLPFPDRDSSGNPDDVPDALPAPLGLPQTLRTRRSTLRYADQPVSTSGVIALLRNALAEERRTWGLDDAAGPLEAFVFALRSTDLPPGAYRVTPEAGTLIAPLDELGPPEDLGIQREFSTAAGMVAMYAALDHADEWAGAHGYRISASRASMATYDFHLGCIARGLVGTIFGGFIPSAVRRIVQGDGVTRHPLIAATYGVAPSP